jgi:hypothetical protein
METPQKPSTQELLSEAYRVLTESKRLVAQRRELTERAREIVEASFKVPYDTTTAAESS